MFAGIGGLLTALVAGELDADKLMTFIGFIALGLSTFGIRQAVGPGIQGGVPIQTPNPNKQTGPAPVG